LTPADVLALSLLVTDAAGVHPARPIVEAGAAAILAECEARPLYLYVHASGVETCVSLFVTHSFRESGWRLDAVGDNGTSFGPFQDKLLGHKPRTWEEATAHFGRLLKRASVCETPLEMLASGHCGAGAGRDISTARVREAERVLLAWRLGAPDDPHGLRP
jgi:hypothetical protein